MTKQLKFGIIGCGRIAHRHAEIIISLGKLQAVCDIIFEKALSFSTQYQAIGYRHLDDLLLNEKDIDVIVICTPNGLHAAQSIQALHSGFHVLVEKPMALNTTDCKAMMAAASKAQKKLWVVKQNRFNPPVVAVKKIIDKGLLGKVFNIQLNCFWNRNESYYQSDWKGTKLLDGGILFTQFSHFIDLLYWFFGDVSFNYSIIENFLHKGIIEFEDTGVTILKFSNGMIGTINFTVNSYLKNMEGSLTVFGEKGAVKIGGQYLNEIEYQLIDNYTIPNLPKGNAANDYGNYIGSMSNHDLEYRDFYNTLQSGNIDLNNAFEGMKTVEIIQKIYQSAEQKKS